MPTKSKLLLATAALLGLLIIGLLGWCVGTLGQSRESSSAASPENSTEPTPLIADLKTDWSNTVNPNPKLAGTWSYNEDAQPLIPVVSWAALPGISGFGT